METSGNGDGLRKGSSPAERTHYLKGLNHMISRSKRAVAGTFAAAVLGLAGVAGVAIASDNTDTCTHGVATNSSGHRQVVYESSRNSAGQHVHKYKHDVNNWPDHHPERNCNH